MGEYARSLTLAQAVQRRWPAAEIHFMLSRAAPYAALCPFPATLLDASPTFHTPEIVRQIADWRPRVVLFDNAGRSAQLRAARRAGAALVFISARARQRRRAFRLRWMRLLDEHWIAYPAFLAGALTFLERLKLSVAGRPQVRYLDVVAPLGDTIGRGRAPDGDFLLLVPGGGTGHPDAQDAIGRFIAAAGALARAGHRVLLVGVPEPGEPGVQGLSPVPQAELIGLLRAAQVVVSNGGSTLLQSLACGAATVAVPIAGDQGTRVRGCAAAGVALAAALDAADMARAAATLATDAAARSALQGRARALNLADGVALALAALARFAPDA